ncbi:156_t:CDS:2, partial [Entrophospora sp. SA101]
DDNNDFEGYNYLLEIWLSNDDGNEFNDHQQSHNNNTEKHRIYDDDDNDDHQIKHQQVKLEEEH